MSTAIVLSRPAEVKEPPRPWQRLPTENEEQFFHFERYLRLPKPRRIRALIGVAQLAVASWFSTFSWMDRARQFDEHMSTIYEQEIADALRSHARDIATQYIQMGGSARALIMSQIDKLLEMDRDNEHLVMRPVDIAKLISVISKLDRLFAGQSTENVEVKSQDNLSGLSVDDLKRLREIRQKLDGST
jgi:hypothetical protein